MDNKTISWVSYLTIIGWIIALVKYNEIPEAERASLPRFHLRQSFGIMALGFLVYVLARVILYSVFAFWRFYSLVWVIDLGLFVLWIIGLIAAINGEEKKVPLLGESFQKWFTFVK